MTDQQRVSAFLQAHVGFHFCSFCLSREVDIVIHGPERAVVPDAATLWDPVATKAEADDAVAKAQEWIDKRF